MSIPRLLLADLLVWLAHKLDPAMATDPADPLTLKITTDLGSVANLGSATLKFITDLQEEANSPDMQKAAAAKKKLSDMDALVIAQQSNDLEAERKAAENASP